MPDVMPMIHREREMLAGDLERLTPEQWQAPSLCDKWNVQQLVGHITAAGNITFLHFFPRFVAAGFNFDKTVGRDLVSYAAGTPDEVLARYRMIINSNRTPPAPKAKEVALGEIMMHGEDIRRSVGSPGTHPDEHLLALADSVRASGAPWRGKTRSAGLRLTATEVEWTRGDGPEVRGPAMSLILAMAGRSKALEECAGEGVDTMRARM